MAVSPQASVVNAMALQVSRLMPASQPWPPGWGVLAVAAAGELRTTTSAAAGAVGAGRLTSSEPTGTIRFTFAKPQSSSARASIW
jgi:hypothetical protein